VHSSRVGNFGRDRSQHSCETPDFMGTAKVCVGSWSCENVVARRADSFGFSHSLGHFPALPRRNSNGRFYLDQRASGEMHVHA
jgi:hypothetical protein